MKTQTRILFTLLCCFFLHTSAAEVNRWSLPITSYSRQTYRAGAENAQSIQSSCGWMYFANDRGLLEFDGTKWELFSMNKKKMTTLCEVQDRIYAGGLHEFGYFEPNISGKLVYTSLSSSYDVSQVENILFIFHINNKTYFCAKTCIYIYNGSHIDIVPINSLDYATVIRDNLYFGCKDGIYMVDNNTFKQLPNSNVLGKHVIKGLFDYQDMLIVATKSSGLFTYEREKITPFKTANDALLKADNISCTTSNQSGTILLGTVSSGIIFVEPGNKKVVRIGVEEGLQSASIRGLSFDRNESLWISAGNGIDCFHTSFSICKLNANIGRGYTSLLYKDNIYLGTSQGLYKIDVPTEIGGQTILESLLPTIGRINMIIEHNDELLIAGVNGFYVYNGKTMYDVPECGDLWGVHPFISPDKLIAYGPSGIHQLTLNNGRWVYTKCLIDNKRYAAKNFLKEPNNEKNYWIANKEGGLHRLTLNEEGDSIVAIKNYNTSEVPAGQNICIANINGNITFATQRGIFKYNKAQDTIEHDETLENLMYGKSSYSYIMQDPLKQIWFTHNGAMHVLRYNYTTHTYRRDDNHVYMRNDLIKDFEHVNTFVYNNGTEHIRKVLVGTEEGFSIISKHPSTSQNSAAVHLQIRRMYLLDVEDSLHYGRSIQHDQVIQPVPKIDYKYNSLKIEWTVDNYNPIRSISFSYRLKGYTEKWSNPTEARSRVFTRLPKGKYTFQIRMIQNNTVIEAKELDFEILPPWYQTWWGYSACLLTVLIFILFIYYFIYLQVRNHQLQLEKESKQLQEQNLQKDMAIKNLREESLQNELSFKSEEIISKTLNIVRKNEMLQEIKKGAMSIMRSTKEEDLVAIRRKTLALINQIDTNIQHDEDFETFRKNFNTVHSDFFNKLENSYPDLTNRDKLLCAYVMMNLLSKEIAPLMNISLRGVEISRYRLRRKFNLPEGTNLADFLHRFAEK